MSSISQCVVFILEGSFIFIPNIAFSLAILIPAKNRNRREFMILAGASLTDAVYAFSFILSGIERILIITDGDGDKLITRAECMSRISVPIMQITNPLLGAWALVGAIDRLLAVHFPATYLRLSRRYTATLCIFPILFVLIFHAFHVNLLRNDKTLIPIYCQVSPASNPLFVLLNGVLRFFFVLTGAAIHIELIIFLNKCKRLTCRHEKAPMIAQSSQKRHLRQATTTLGLIVANSVVFMLGGDLVVILRPELATSFILGVCFLTKATLNCVIVLTRHNELRRAVIQILRRNKEMRLSKISSRMYRNSSNGKAAKMSRINVGSRTSISVLQNDGVSGALSGVGRSLSTSQF